MHLIPKEFLKKEDEIWLANFVSEFRDIHTLTCRVAIILWWEVYDRKIHMSDSLGQFDMGMESWACHIIFIVFIIFGGSYEIWGRWGHICFNTHKSALV